MAFRYVEAGGMAVSSGGSGVFSACLGSCVGVVITDRRHAVGGLAHIMLPEPSGGLIPSQSGHYASSAVPELIRRLLAAGATRESLQAVVAGGAFVNSPQGFRFDLDLGGRTLEVVERVLQQERIHVVSSETGGYFSCRLSLDLATWRTRIDPIIETGSLSESALKRPAEGEIDRVIAHIRPIPQIALKVLRMIEGDRYSMTDLAREIRQDQVIAGRIINLCNSPYLGLDTSIESIDQAVVLIGEKNILRLMISAVMEPFFIQSDHGYSLCKGGLYQHVLMVASLSDELARRSGAVSRDVAYTAGLLHDIGKVVLDQYLASNNPLFYRRTQQKGEALEAVEMEELGISHIEAGSRLGRSWGFAPSLLDVIQYHHQPDLAVSHSLLVHIVYLANILVARFHPEHQLGPTDTRNLPISLARLGLGADDLLDLVDRIPLLTPFGMPPDRN